MFFLSLMTGLRGFEVCGVRLRQVCSFNPTMTSIRVYSSIKLEKDQMKGGKFSRTIHLAPKLIDALEDYLQHWKVFAGRLPGPPLKRRRKYTLQEIEKENAKRRRKVAMEKLKGNKMKLTLLGTEDVFEEKFEDILFPSQKASRMMKGYQGISRSSYHDIIKDVFQKNGIADKARLLGTHSMRKSFVIDLYERQGYKGDLLTLMMITGHKRVDTLLHYIKSHTSEVKQAQTGIYGDLLETETEESIPPLQRSLLSPLEVQNDEDFR